MSTVLLVGTAANAHEVLPSIADMELNGDQLNFDVSLNLESFLAGIDQAETTDTNDAPQAIEYDALRALSDSEIAAQFEEFWPGMAENINIVVDGERLDLSLESVTVVATDNLDLPRSSNILFTATAPSNSQDVDVGWASEYGDQAGGWRTFFNYIPVGFDHIVPKGLDHILFVLGLFFLSTKIGPLLWQISAFTLAHTITLALAALGYVTIPGSIVEPLIALSIAYVAIENLYTDGLSRWRPAIIFGFGLLHGLGFASVLAEFGLPQGSFLPALIGFNIGVEIGQLAVIAVAYLCVFKAIENAEKGDADKVLSIGLLTVMVIVILLLIPLSNYDSYADLVPLIATAAILLGLSAVSASVPRFEGYREIVAMPGSILIAIVAIYWCVERVFL